jgi:hypothetical protein
MKLLKLTSLLAALILLCGCNKETIEISEAHPGPYPYHVLISFQDASGNDLVKGIAHDWRQSAFVYESNPNPDAGFVNLDQYTLDVVFPDHIQAVVEYITRLEDVRIAQLPSDLVDSDSMLDSYFVNYIVVCKWGDYYGLDMCCLTPTNDIEGKKLSPTDKATFKLRCPYVFGDDAEHEIVTYWSYPPEKGPYNTYCTRVEFENEEYIPQKFPQPYVQFSAATIVLKRAPLTPDEADRPQV